VGQVKNKNQAPTPPYTMITSPAALESLVAKIKNSMMLAIDLEADSMFHYQEKVCLIQIAVEHLTAVIDPLAVKDLSILKPLFHDDKICKVLHGADYDVRSLYRDFGITINNLFDTQLACMYLGYKETGLESIVAQHFNVELNKTFQKKDWSQRPLPEEMVAYGACDVVFLIPLAKILIKQLELNKRLTWVQEQCVLLSQVRPNENNHAPMFLKVKGAGRLSPRQLAVLESLLETRHRIAAQKDRPLFKIIGNSTLLKLATQIPATMDELKDSRILSDKQLAMYGKLILTAILDAKSIPDGKLPSYPRRKSPRLSPRVPQRVKTVRLWRDKLAARMGLDPALLLNRTLIKEIAVHHPTSIQSLAATPGMHQWQVDAFGSKIVELMKSS
jgi:ribonuclease D